MSITAPYGTWKSPITPELVAGKTLRLFGPTLDGETIFWEESRPTEKGRSVIVRRNPDGTTTDINPAPFNARTRVHEYGGGAVTIDDGTIYFSNFTDQQIYAVSAGQAPRAVTNAPGRRFSNGVITPDKGWMICVVEDHRDPESEEKNSLARVNLSNGNIHTLIEGNDFYASPTLNPSGTRLSWLTWNHPNMPWDGTEVWVAAIDGTGVHNPIKIAGGLDESVFQPQWSPDGILYFTSDRTGWWNLYRWLDGTVEAVLDMEAEFGLPQWVFGMSTYGFASEDEIITAANVEGRWQMLRVNPHKSTWSQIETPFDSVSNVRVSKGQAVFSSGSPTRPSAITRLNLETGDFETIRASSEVDLEENYLSIPQTIEFPTENGHISYGYFYAPKNPEYEAPEGEKPPLIVVSHGGPTGSTSTTMNLSTQYWTSRGFGVLDVNYGGSTGYGREYRQRLNRNWGVVDIDDCVNGAKYLVERELADGERLIIRGGSAGGYTTLGALTFRDVFKAGASYYGVSDLEALALDTHKFESRYLDSMVGPYPETKKLYIERSPIHHVEHLNAPVIFFQGLEDKVVPPNQAEKMVEALKMKGVPVAYVPFEGEQHGFRQAANQQRALEAELYFYGKVFGFEPAEEIAPVEIANLD